MKKALTAALAACTLALGIQPAHAQEVELTFSTYLPPSYEYAWKPIENFVQTVEKESQGRIKINVFHSGQLFDGYEELPALSRGDVDIVNMTSTYPSGTVPALNIFTLPFLFDSTAHLKRALDEGLFKLGAEQELRDTHDAVVLGLAPWDPYEFYSRKTPINSAADVKGKVWASTSSMDARALQLLGGSPTGMPSSELYLAFDRGVIDATPRPLLTGIGRNLYEVAKHLSIANFGIDVSVLTINRKKWDSLPADLQDIISKAARQRDAEQFERVNAFVEHALQRYEQAGVTINRVEPAQLDEMRKLTRPAIDEWSKQVENGPAYLALIEKTRQP